MIELAGVTKRYGDTVAVDDLSIEIPAGRVTGFLGPNGAGKSTTMRMIVGLDAPSAGRVSVNGRQYADMRYPLHEVGALLEAKAIHPGRSARNHLRWLADSNAIPRRQVDEVLEQVGLTSVARKRAGGFSLGVASGSASPLPRSVIPVSSFSTSRSTAWTPRASNGCGTSCVRWLQRVERSSCRAT